MNQNEKVDPRKKWIQWVLDFVQTDLSALPKLRTDALIEEMSNFLSLLLIDNNVVVDSGWRGMWKEVHKTVLGRKLSSLQNALRQMVEWLKKPIGNHELPPVKYWLIGLEGRFSKSWVHDLTDEQYWERLAAHNFSDLINGIQINSIRKCKGCGRYFVDLTKRKKIFCTYPCASRSIARFKREELKKNPKQYKAYLKKQRKYLRKRYEEMRKVQLGPNVKVGRKGR